MLSDEVAALIHTLPKTQNRRATRRHISVDRVTEFADVDVSGLINLEDSTSTLNQMGFSETRNVFARI